MTDPLIASLTRAVEAAPDDVRLRTHLAELLIGIGRGAEAVTHCAIALQHAPTDDAARALMARALSPQARQTPAEQAASMLEEPVTDVSTSAAGAPQKEEAPSEAVATPPAPESPEAPEFNSSTTSDGTGNFDWRRAEEDLGGPAAPFVSSRPSEPSGSDSPLSEPRLVGTDGDPADWEVERAGVRLADVGGMTEVKNRLEASFLAPLRNPELRRLYGKSLRGGLLLYGPPGTGKTFIARAIAGEMGAGFLSVTISDILDPYIGNSEANLHNVFQQARDHAPCVLFLDELDAIGMKRSLSRNSSMRSTVNQLLEELDGVGSNNEGVYLLAATNAPWDIDPALRRPGRLDRTLLVLPPDEPARAAILHTHLRERPVEGIDLQALARVTDGLTGADLSHVCDSAA
ncbi:MAG: AAA family ATPase, partial [Actinomyces oris]